MLLVRASHLVGVYSLVFCLFFLFNFFVFFSFLFCFFLSLSVCLSAFLSSLLFFYFHCSFFLSFFFWFEVPFLSVLDTGLNSQGHLALLESAATVYCLSVLRSGIAGMHDQGRSDRAFQVLQSGHLSLVAAEKPDEVSGEDTTGCLGILYL